MTTTILNLTSTGGELGQTVNDNHHPQPNIANINLAAILFTEGLINQSPVRFLLDSVAALSVIRLESLPKQKHSDITETKTSAVSAS